MWKHIKAKYGTWQKDRVKPPDITTLVCAGWGERSISQKRTDPKDGAIFLDEEQLQRCLRQGMLRTGIQINDYQEILCLYCAAHHLDNNKYEDMLQIFEQEASEDTELKQKSHTSQLWNMYRVQKDKEPADFLEWMLEHASMFKGYGKWD